VPLQKGIDTDDVGTFRIAGLASGQYLLGALKGGSYADSVEADGRFGYAYTYHPGTAHRQRAAVLAVRSGSGTSVHFALARRPVLRVVGVLRDGAGRPASQGLVRVLDADTYSPLAVGHVRTNGGFDVDVVSPTDEVVIVATTAIGRDATIPVEVAASAIALSERAERKIQLRSQPGGRVRGKVVVDTGRVADIGRKLRVFAKALQSTSYFPPSLGVTVGADGTFELLNIHEPSVFLADVEGTGWYVERIQSGGRDITDSGLRPSSGQVTTDVKIVLTRTTQRLRGTVIGGSRRLSVVAFAADSTLWDFPDSRYVRVARPDTAGQFEIAGVRPAEYCIAAVEALDLDLLANPATLEALRYRSRLYRIDRGSTVHVDVRADGGNIAGCMSSSKPRSESLTDRRGTTVRFGRLLTGPSGDQ
jgi:hypothetical protein